MDFRRGGAVGVWPLPGDFMARPKLGLWYKRGRDPDAGRNNQPAGLGNEGEGAGYGSPSGFPGPGQTLKVEHGDGQIPFCFTVRTCS